MPRSACDYRTVTLDAVNGPIDDMHELDFGGRCQAGQLVGIVGGNGAW